MDDVSAPTSSILETKILLNSIISDADDGEKFMSCDLKDFFLATLMYSGESMIVAKNKSFRSQLINLAPSSASEIILFRRIFVSRMEEVGADTSSAYTSLSPPTTILVRYFSSFSGLKLQTMEAYVTFASAGIWNL